MLLTDREEPPETESNVPQASARPNSGSHSEGKLPLRARRRRNCRFRNDLRPLRLSDPSNVCAARRIYVNEVLGL